LTSKCAPGYCFVYISICLITVLIFFHHFNNFCDFW
jgi:hypothetical protein